MRHIYECKILIVDDHLELLQMITEILTKEGFLNIITASDCHTARTAFSENSPELIILDIMLPDGDGFSLMREFRLVSNVPILFLSAKDEDNDRLLGLGLGADDYVTKSFLPKELILRMTAILKRTYFSESLKVNQSEILTLGSCQINLKNACVTNQNETVSLTAKELALLVKLNENRGNIVTFDSLCRAVWNDDYYGYENTLMVHIRRLREKIEPVPSKPRWLLTARGLGYRLAK